MIITNYYITHCILFINKYLTLILDFNYSKKIRLKDLTNSEFLIFKSKCRILKTMQTQLQILKSQIVVQVK